MAYQYVPKGRINVSKTWRKINEIENPTDIKIWKKHSTNTSIKNTQQIWALVVEKVVKKENSEKKEPDTEI